MSAKPQLGRRAAIFGRRVTFPGVLAFAILVMLVTTTALDAHRTTLPMLSVAFRVVGGALLGASVTVLLFAVRKLRWLIFVAFGAVFVVLEFAVSRFAAGGFVIGGVLAWFPHCLPPPRRR